MSKHASGTPLSARAEIAEGKTLWTFSNSQEIILKRFQVKGVNTVLIKNFLVFYSVISVNKQVVTCLSVPRDSSRPPLAAQRRS